MSLSLPERAKSSRFISRRKLGHVAADVALGDQSVDASSELPGLCCQFFSSLSSFNIRLDLSSGVLAVDSNVRSCQLHFVLVSLDQ